MRFDNVFIDGSGVIANRDVADDIRDTLRSFKGQHCDVVIEPHRDRRSERANAYLWGVVYKAIAEYTGHPAEAVHEAMVTKFLPSEAQRLSFFERTTGEVLEVDINPRRSSKLTGTAFYDFVEEVRAFAREFLGVETPDPDPEYWRAAAKSKV